MVVGDASFWGGLILTQDFNSVVDICPVPVVVDGIKQGQDWHETGQH